MVMLHPEYLIEKKRRKAVMLPIAEWERIIDEIHDSKLLVLVVIIGDRKNIYR